MRVALCVSISDRGARVRGWAHSCIPCGDVSVVQSSTSAMSTYMREDVWWMSCKLGRRGALAHVDEAAGWTHNGRRCS